MYQWQDMTRQFKQEVEHAMIQYVLKGNNQPITDIIQSIQRDSYNEGVKSVLESGREFNISQEEKS